MNTHGPSTFLNGDRYFFAKSNFHPAIPEKVKIGKHICRVSYRSQTTSMRRCKRCRLDGHQIGDTSICPAYMKPRTELLAFVNGPLSNFDRCDVTMDSMTFITSEHCYQWKAAKDAHNDAVAVDWRQGGNSLALCYFAVVMELPDSLWMNCKSEFGVIFLRCSPT